MLMRPTSCGKSQGRTDAAALFCLVLSILCGTDRTTSCLRYESPRLCLNYEERRKWISSVLSSRISVHLNKASDARVVNRTRSFSRRSAPQTTYQRGSQHWCFQPVSLSGHKLPNIKGIVHQKWVQTSCFWPLVWRHSQHSPSVWKSSDIFLFLL